MATHSSTLAWTIPWMEEPGRLQSMGSLRVGHYWVISLSLFTFMHWRRKWQPTQVFLPGESQGLGSLVGCCQWGCRVRHDWSDLAAAAVRYCLECHSIGMFLILYHNLSYHFSVRWTTELSIIIITSNQGCWLSTWLFTVVVNLHHF